MCLNIQSPAGGAVWENCWTFRRWSLPGGSTSQWVGLEALWPSSTSCFLSTSCFCCHGFPDMMDCISLELWANIPLSPLRWFCQGMLTHWWKSNWDSGPKWERTQFYALYMFIWLHFNYTSEGAFQETGQAPYALLHSHFPEETLQMTGKLTSTSLDLTIPWSPRSRDTVVAAF